MKNIMYRTRPEQPMLIRIVGIAALVCCLSISKASADDSEHPLLPSHVSNDARAIFTGGVPPGPVSESPAPGAEVGGASLYAVHCSSCHGAQLEGSPGVPSLEHIGIASVDFYVRTGRMPLAITIAPSNAARSGATMTQAFHAPPLLDDAQATALEAFIARHTDGSPSIPDVRIEPASLERGRKLFEDNCEACHGAAGQGATVGYNWTAPPLDKATPVEIGEAIRIGPGMMPRFSAAVLSESDVDAVTTYVHDLATEPQTYGGTVMYYVGPAAEGAVGAIFGVGSLFWVVYFIGTKADGRRVHELGRPPVGHSGTSNDSEVSQ